MGSHFIPRNIALEYPKMKTVCFHVLLSAGQPQNKQVRLQDAYRQTRWGGAVKTVQHPAPFSKTTSLSLIVCYI